MLPTPGTGKRSARVLFMLETLPFMKRREVGSCSGDASVTRFYAV